MDSETGLIVQSAGICLIAVLFVFLTNTLKSDALRYWRNGWLALPSALVCLLIAVNFQPAKPFFILYYLGEYIFAFFLIAGCRNYTSGEKISVRHWWWILPGALTAVLLVLPVNSFIETYNFHSFIMSACFAVAFYALKPVHKPGRDNFGWRVMRIAIALLVVDFLHYAIIYSLRKTSYSQALGAYLAFNSIIDLVVEILLGFGMVIVLLERVRQDVEETNHKLKEAHDKLERLANVDPLTDAFTRHAFYSFLQKHNKTGNVSGCVGVFDIDNLKPINDRLGHTTGDVAISTVARAIRTLVRADDLIFRWGGDEFFVVMLGFDSNQAIERMGELNETLKNVNLLSTTEKISIGVSFGFADFSDINDLEKSVKKADAEMYKTKQQKKCADTNEPLVSISASSDASAMLN
jgi:diguanylate cyclase (GGDEF)-like protein